MFDFPTLPATGTVVTVPDGSYRVWDSQKWRAAPSANVIIPPNGLPLTGGTLTGNLTINKTTTYAGTTASLSDAALNIAQTSSGNITGTGEVDHNSLVITDTLSVNPPANVIASFQAQIDGTTLSLNSLASPPVAVTFTGSISGNTLTILSGIPGLAPGSTVQWSGGTDMVQIAAGPGLWTLYNTHGTVSSQAMTGLLNTFSVMASISGSTLTVASLYGPGAITAGMQVQWNLPTAGATTIITGPAGGPYTLVNPSGTIPLQPMLLLGPQPAQTVTWDSGDPDNPGTATVGSYITGHPAQFSLLTNQGTVSSRPMQTVKAIQNRNVFGFSSFLNYGGGDGSRYGWRLNISQTAAMAGHAYYLPAYIVNNLRYPSGGTDLWAGAKGAGWAGNTVMNFIKPATTAVGDPGPINYRGGSSWEFDYQCLAGSPDDPAWPKASTASLGGIAVIRGGQSTWETPMWEADYAIAIAQAGPSVRDASNNIVPPKRAKYGIRFNGLSGIPTLDPSYGRAIAAVYPPGAFATDGSLGLYPNVAPFGVDWLSMDYTRAAYRWRGGAVLGSATPLPGALAIGGGYLSATNTTVSLDTAGSVCTGATVAPGQGGANCYLGMVCQDDVSGTQVVVTGVDGAVSPRIGAATTVVLIPRTGQSHNAELPTNPVQFRPMGNPITFLAPGPTGPKLTLTWTAPSTLALQPSGGATVFGGPVSVPGQIAVPAGGSIQAAHDALPSTGGSILLAANTVFDATSTVTISKNNVRLSGPSWATIVRRNASFTSGVLINVTGSGCVVENFTVDGNAVVTSVGELNANGNNSLVRNMQIMNSKGTIHLALSGNNSRATGNTIAGPGVDLGIQTGYGIWAANHNTVMIDHNVITGTCIDGIGVDGNGTQVIGNRVSGCHCYAASSGGQIATYPGAGTGNGVIIMGNTVGTGGSLQAHGIEVDGTNEVVSGNVVDTVQGYGILVVGNGAVITGNILRNIGQLPGSIDGIAVRPNVSDFVISGNRIIDDQGTPTMRFAISVAAGTSDNYAITGNRIMSGVNSTQPTSDAGTGLHKVVDNNAGLNDLVRSVAATGTFTVPPTPTIQITGSGTVTAVNGSLFTGRQGMLIPTGATVFTAGATIGNTVTCTPNVPLNFVFDGTKLYLH